MRNKQAVDAGQLAQGAAGALGPVPAAITGGFRAPQGEQIGGAGGSAIGSVGGQLAGGAGGSALGALLGSGAGAVHGAATAEGEGLTGGQSAGEKALRQALQGGALGAGIGGTAGHLAGGAYGGVKGYQAGANQGSKSKSQGGSSDSGSKDSDDSDNEKEKESSIRKTAKVTGQHFEESFQKIMNESRSKTADASAPGTVMAAGALDPVLLGGLSAASAAPEGQGGQAAAGTMAGGLAGQAAGGLGGGVAGGAAGMGAEALSRGSKAFKGAKGGVPAAILGGLGLVGGTLSGGAYGAKKGYESSVDEGWF